MRINPTGCVKTPCFTESNPSSPMVHPTPSSRQDTTDSASIRPPTATQNAPPHCVVADPGLAAVVDAWPDLPEAMKAGIVAMVKAAFLRHPARGGSGRAPGEDGDGIRVGPPFTPIVGRRRLMFEAGSHDPASGRSGGRGDP